MKIFLLKRNPPPSPKVKIFFLRRKREKFLEEELGESRDQVSLDQHTFKIKPKTQDDILKIISNQYLPEVNKLFFKFFYGPCNPGGAQDDTSTIISNQYLSKQILWTLNPGGAYWRQSALTGQGFFAKMVKISWNYMKYYKMI